MTRICLACHFVVSHNVLSYGWRRCYGHHLIKDLQGRGIFARKLNTGGKAYNSYHMTVLGPEIEELIPVALKSLSPSDRLRSDAKFFCSVIGEPKSTGSDATYWKANMESPRLFSQAMQCLMKKCDVHLVEFRPHSALELPTKQIGRSWMSWKIEFHNRVL